jgi:hypothetical protein
MAKKVFTMPGQCLLITAKPFTNTHLYKTPPVNGLNHRCL